MPERRSRRTVFSRRWAHRSGYALKFSNGFVVCLTGDTGHVSDMATIIRDYYRPKLVIFNIGDIFTTGPEEAAFAVTELIHARAVVPSHANEVATAGGVMLPGTKTARFTELAQTRAGGYTKGDGS